MFSKTLSAPAARSYRKSPKASDFRGGSVSYALPARVAADLEVLARYYSISPSDVLAQMVDDYLALRSHILDRGRHMEGASGDTSVIPSCGETPLPGLYPLFSPFPPPRPPGRPETGGEAENL